MKLNDKYIKYQHEVINHALEKFEDIMAEFKGYSLIVHTNEEESYNTLKNDHYVIEVVNPYNQDNLYLTFTNIFKISFKKWSANYLLDHYYDFKNDARCLVNGDYAIVNFYHGKEFIANHLFKSNISYMSEPYDFVRSHHFNNYQLKRIDKHGLTIIVDAWKPSDCYEFNMNSKLKPEMYRYVKRNGVRFIIKDGRCLGSGCLKHYKPEFGYITYIYVEDQSNYNELFISLLKILESDAKELNYNFIFANINRQEYDLYRQCGFSEIPKVENDKINQLNGARIAFDLSVMKQIENRD